MFEVMRFLRLYGFNVYLKTSKPYNLKTSKPYNLKTAQPYNRKYDSTLRGRD